MSRVRRIGGRARAAVRTGAGTVRLGLRAPHLVGVARRVRAERLTYLGTGALHDLALAVVALERRGLPGGIVEAGTALGGSGLVLAAAKRDDRRLDLYDAFGMIPPPSDADGADVHERYRTIVEGRSAGIDGDLYYGYREDLLGEVTATFRRFGTPLGEHGVEAHPGLFDDTLRCDGPVALAHLDGDWYESTRTCLERIVPQLVVGGRLVVDDYGAWSGCRRAVDEYFAGRGDFRRERHSRLHLVRVA